MSFLTPRTPPPPPPPELPPEPDLGKAAVMAEEEEMKRRKSRKGVASTIVAGALGETVEPTTGKPTLMS